MYPVLGSRKAVSFGKMLIAEHRCGMGIGLGSGDRVRVMTRARFGVRFYFAVVLRNFTISTHYAFRRYGMATALGVELRSGLGLALGSGL